MLIEKTRVSNEALQALPKVKVGNVSLFTCEFPVKSPEFKNPKDVIRWYCELEQKEKMQFKKLGGFVVSELNVALNDVLVGKDVYHRGEVISEMDVMKFDFANGRWVNLKN